MKCRKLIINSNKDEERLKTSMNFLKNAGVRYGVGGLFSHRSFIIYGLQPHKIFSLSLVAFCGSLNMIKLVASQYLPSLILSNL